MWQLYMPKRPLLNWFAKGNKQIGLGWDVGRPSIFVLSFPILQCSSLPFHPFMVAYHFKFFCSCLLVFWCLYFLNVQLLISSIACTYQVSLTIHYLFFNPTQITTPHWEDFGSQKILRKPGSSINVTPIFFFGTWFSTPEFGDSFSSSLSPSLGFGF